MKSISGEWSPTCMWQTFTHPKTPKMDGYKCMTCTSHYYHIVISNWSGIDTGTMAFKQKAHIAEKIKVDTICPLCQTPNDIGWALTRFDSPRDKRKLHQTGGSSIRRERRDKQKNRPLDKNVASHSVHTFTKGVYMGWNVAIYALTATKNKIRKRWRLLQCINYLAWKSLVLFRKAIKKYVRH